MRQNMLTVVRDVGQIALLSPSLGRLLGRKRANRVAIKSNVADDLEDVDEIHYFMLLDGGPCFVNLCSGMECPNCGGTSFVDNDVEAERVCDSCGMVVECGQIVYPDWDNFDCSALACTIQSRNALYKRLYHLNER